MSVVRQIVEEESAKQWIRRRVGNVMHDFKRDLAVGSKWLFTNVVPTHLIAFAQEAITKRVPAGTPIPVSVNSVTEWGFWLEPLVDVHGRMPNLIFFRWSLTEIVAKRNADGSYALYDDIAGILLASFKKM